MSTRVTSRFLDLRALSALEHMRFTTRRRVEGAFMGYHASRQLGGAGEFVDFREYTGGEDLRRLDWKVLARTGKAFVRIHEEETNLICTLVIDASGSMRFGAAGRRDTAGLEARVRAVPGHGPVARDQPQPGPRGPGRAQRHAAGVAGARGPPPRTSNTCSN